MIAALIVAAGQGRRMGAERPKQYLQLAGRPILAHTLTCFDRCTKIDHIFLVVPESQLDHCRYEVVGPAALFKPVTLVAGGARRQESVYNGLCAMADADGIVLIHDGVRPFLSTSLILACIAGAQKYGACIPALPVVDTLKRIESDHRIHSTVARDQLYLAQTPQTFRHAAILAAHTDARRKGWIATDDASLMEKMGARVHVVPGLRENIKITTPEDLAWAELHLKMGAQEL